LHNELQLRWHRVYSTTADGYQAMEPQ